MMDNISKDTATDTIKCMCGHIVNEDNVVFINPATEAITWAGGLPFCPKCVPVPRENL